MICKGCKPSSTSNNNDDDDEEDIYGHGKILDDHLLTIDSNYLQWCNDDDDEEDIFGHGKCWTSIL